MEWIHNYKNEWWDETATLKEWKMEWIYNYKYERWNETITTRMNDGMNCNYKDERLQGWKMEWTVTIIIKWTIEWNCNCKMNDGMSLLKFKFR